MFFNSEEEVSSPVSRAITGPIAQRMDAVLVLEAGRMNGDIVSARKGSGEFILSSAARRRMPVWSRRKARMPCLSSRIKSWRCIG